MGLGFEGFLAPSLVLQGPGPTLLCEAWSLELQSNPEEKRDLPKISLPLEPFHSCEALSNGRGNGFGGTPFLDSVFLFETQG